MWASGNLNGIYDAGGWRSTWGESGYGQDEEPDALESPLLKSDEMDERRGLPSPRRNDAVEEPKYCDWRDAMPSNVLPCYKINGTSAILFEIFIFFYFFLP